MLELLELFQAALGQQRDLAGVDLVARDGQDDVAGVDEAAQHGHQQVRLQAEFHRVEVLHVRLSVQQLAAVQHLAMPLGLQAAQHFLRVARAPRLDAVAIQHLQRVEDGIGVLGAGAAGQCLQRVAHQLLSVGLGDQDREGRVLGRDLSKLLVERQAGDDVDDVAEVGALIRSQTEPVTDIDAFGPVLQVLGLALVGDLERGHLLFLQPLAHVAQCVFGFVQVDGLGAAAGGRGKVLCCGIKGQMALYGVVQAFEPDEHLIRLVLVAEARGLEGLNEVDVEIALGLGGGPVVRGSEEQVAIAVDAPVLPLDLVLPDLMTRDVGALVGAFHQLLDSAVVGAVQRVIRQGLSTLLDLRVVVDVLLEVEEVLLGVWRLGDELAVDRLDDLTQGGLHGGEQVVGRVAAHVLDARLVQTQRVAQFGSGWTDRHVDVTACGESMHRQASDHALRHRLVGRAGESLEDTFGQDFRDLQHRTDAGVRAQHAV